MISGIVHVLKSSGRWVDAPAEYGAKKTLYNRFVRWAAKGVRIDLIHARAQVGGPPGQVLIDSSAVKARRSASGGKVGEKSGYRTSRKLQFSSSAKRRSTRMLAWRLGH